MFLGLEGGIQPLKGLELHLAKQLGLIKNPLASGKASENDSSELIFSKTCKHIFSTEHYTLSKWLNP
jgi:hypothetical protein